ncbi:GNAT family N-acetyltransferase [Aquabacter cavernae]|uniref:GNAT family N-acetyltransferase n=1 Tax=Aquabacter cavernae TaxID=2496029 RepID=UPI000F8ECD85|nr:GNAT family N-acetyltransferase [Aquabacter cavernae]
MSLFGRLLSGTPSEPHLRDARMQDAPDLARLHGASFHRGWGVDEFERLLTDRAAHAHVMTDGPKGAPFAFVLSHVVPPEGEILSLAVAPASRKKGHARRLLAHHLSRLAALGVTVSHLEVDAANTAALGLYHRLGYVEAGRRKGYYREAGQASDALVMRRDF